MPAMSHKTQPGIQTHRYTQVRKVHIPLIYTYSHQQYTGTSHIQVTYKCTPSHVHIHVHSQKGTGKLNIQKGVMFCTTYVGQVLFR